MVSLSSRRLSNECKVIIAVINQVVLDELGVSTVYLCICLLSLLVLYMYTGGSLDFFVLVKSHDFLRVQESREDDKSYQKDKKQSSVS